MGAATFARLEKERLDEAVSSDGEEGQGKGDTEIAEMEGGAGEEDIFTQATESSAGIVSNEDITKATDVFLQRQLMQSHERYKLMEKQYRCSIQERLAVERDLVRANQDAINLEWETSNALRDATEAKQKSAGLEKQLALWIEREKSNRRMIEECETLIKKREATCRFLADEVNRLQENADERYQEQSQTRIEAQLSSILSVAQELKGILDDGSVSRARVNRGREGLELTKHSHDSADESVAHHRLRELTTQIGKWYYALMDIRDGLACAGKEYRSLQLILDQMTQANDETQRVLGTAAPNDATGMLQLLKDM